MDYSKFGIDTTWYFPNDNETTWQWLQRLNKIDSNKTYDLLKWYQSKGIDPRNDQQSRNARYNIFVEDNKDKLKNVVSYVDETTNQINKLKNEYDVTSDEGKRYELSMMIKSLYNDIPELVEVVGKAGLWEDNPDTINKYLKVNKYIDSIDVDENKKNLEDYNERINKVDPSKKLQDVNTGVSNISIKKGEDGNPVIEGKVGYVADDKNLSLDELRKVINDRLNTALASFLQSDEYTNKQKIDALDEYFVNNPNYTTSDLYNVVKLKNNLYKDINTITSSNLSMEEKILRLNDLEAQYKDWASQNAGVIPLSLSDMWEDFGINKDFSDRGLLKLSIDTTEGGNEISKALDMYLSNKSIYEDAIKNYEGMVKNYTADNLTKLGETYGDIASKTNAQKVDNQVTNSAKALGVSDAIATQLGNEAQYQKYSENLADNQKEQTENITNYANNDMSNQYAKIQSAYNNASQSEQSLMSEADKKQADINAFLTKEGVGVANDKYNYEHKIQPVQIATNIGANAVNSLNALKNASGNNNNTNK